MPPASDRRPLQHYAFESFRMSDLVSHDYRDKGKFRHRLQAPLALQIGTPP